MSDKDHSTVDLLIVGGGPAGLFAAFYAGLRQMSVKILDSLEALGGQLVTLYPEKYIYDVAGYPRVLAKDLAARLIEQGLQYHPQVCLGEQVRQLVYDEQKSTYTIVTVRGRHVCRAILICAGVGAFVPRRLSLENAAEYEGRGLYYFVSRMAELANQRVLIVGGGDSAVDWAHTLCDLAAEVTLIHRRDEFRAHEDSVQKLRCSRVKLELFHELKAIGGQERLQWATIFDNRSSAQRTVEVDAVLVNIGFQNSLGPIKDWGLELSGGQIVVDSRMRTSRPGIFGAGDIVTYEGKLKLIATGFGEAAIAVNNAKKHIDPAARVFPGHSSEMGLEGVKKPAGRAAHRPFAT